jgi:hypothetical protein
VPPGVIGNLFTGKETGRLARLAQTKGKSPQKIARNFVYEALCAALLARPVRCPLSAQ